MITGINLSYFKETINIFYKITSRLRHQRSQIAKSLEFPSFIDAIDLKLQHVSVLKLTC